MDDQVGDEATGRDATVTDGCLLLKGDARRLPLADKSVHMCCTSPPYWSLRDYQVAGQIGLEHSHEDYVRAIVGVFREVWRVLRDDGTVWLNLGDSFHNGDKGGHERPNVGSQARSRGTAKGLAPSRLWQSGLKPKDLVGIPWRVALALQADGWHLRSDIIWSKTNPMPESVVDRPAKSHEYLFLLTKRPRYYYDHVAVCEQASDRSEFGRLRPIVPMPSGTADGVNDRRTSKRLGNGSVGSPSGRNRRSVWTISCRSYKGAHFATFPEALVRPCIKAGTSEKGVCPACGKGWVRLIEKDRRPTRPGADTKIAKAEAVDGRIVAGRLDANVVGNRDPRRHVTTVETVGWAPGCKCDAGDPVPAVVLDCFNGAGTSGLVALSLGRRYVGVDLKPEYLAMSAARIAGARPATAPAPARRRKVAAAPLPGQGTLFDLSDGRTA